MKASDTQELTRAGDPALSEDEPRVAHIVKDPNRVFVAYVEGTPLEAVCGVVFVPSRDPKKLPICEMCKELYDAAFHGVSSHEDLQ